MYCYFSKYDCIQSSNDEVPACDGCDPADQMYTPKVNLDDKPWFNDDGKEDSSVSAAKNVTRYKDLK